MSLYNVLSGYLDSIRSSQNDYIILEEADAEFAEFLKSLIPPESADKNGADYKYLSERIFKSASPAPESNLPPRKSFTDVNPFSPPTESAGAKASPEKPQSGRQWEDTENIRSAKNIDTLRLRMLGCERCGLCKARTRLVFGAGSHSADVFFIGEGPGQEEDKQGLPFVGRSGVLLTQMMYAAGLNRDGIYISNIVKCRPPNNRNPQPEEVVQCLPVLERQIELIAPSLIVLLGSVALKALMPENSLPISRSREQFMEYRGIPVLVTFHPAYILRRPEALYDAWNDFRRIRAFLSKLRKSSSAL